MFSLDDDRENGEHSGLILVEISEMFALQVTDSSLEQDYSTKYRNSNGTSQSHIHSCTYSVKHSTFTVGTNMFN